MNEPTPAILLHTAIQAARKAGQHARDQRHRRRETNAIGRNDVKLKLDVECQEIATQVVLSAFPQHAVLGEEDDPADKDGNALASRNSPYEWVIDPIDGTVNFFHGNPYWCCSVAVRRDGEVLAGCVYAPEMDMLFEAAIDSPALCNGQPISVSDTPELALASVHTGADKEEIDNYESFKFFYRIASHVQRPRIMGAAALDVCFVAHGAADGYFQPAVYIWDIAAADLILRRAGGHPAILKRWSERRMAYLGSNQPIHDALVAQIKPLLDEQVFNK